MSQEARTRLWVLEEEGPATVLVDLPDDVRQAREAYLEENEAVFASTDPWSRDANQGLQSGDVP